MLQENGRIPISKIAESVGFSVMGVKKRVEKLEKSNLLKIRSLLNIKNLGVKLAIIAIEMKNAEFVEKTIDKFRNCPRVLRFFVTTGSFNLFAIIVAEDYHTLESISLEKCSLRNQEGIKRFEIYPVQDVYYTPYFDLNVIPKKELDYAPCGVHCSSCSRYKEERCVGCPVTVHYRGVL
jgi:DNA-binding Lrp family transcriptional regulator